MSEPIQTVEELADEFSEMITSANRTLASLMRSDVKFHAAATFHNANRILDYLGLDYCKDGETPRERIASLANGVRQLTAERDRYREALSRVARLWRASLPRPKGGQQAGAQHYVINAETSKELQRLLIAAGLDPDTLGMED